MFVLYLPGIWRNRRGVAYVLRHPRSVPLVTAVTAWMSIILLVGLLSVAGFIAANQMFGVHLPNYYCKAYVGMQQPEGGCQKDQVTLNFPRQ